MIAIARFSVRAHVRAGGFRLLRGRSGRAKRPLPANSQGIRFGVASTSPSSSLSGRYAAALYELAHDAKALDAVAQDLSQLKAMIDRKSTRLNSSH